MVPKLSKLDRYLVSEDVFDTFNNLEVAVSDRNYLDHCRILLHARQIDYGPSAFKFYNSLLQIEGLMRLFVVL